MRSSYLFLLVYLLGSCFGSSATQRNATCVTPETCGQGPDPTSHFLRCVGLSSNDTGRDHMRRLKGMLEATMDVYTFMKSSMTGVPLLSLQGALDINPGADPLQNEALVQMWIEVKIKPLLRSITKHFLSCLSTKNFSCSTYQTMVRELSYHFSEMNPVRQKWIYTFFMYPFLSGDRVAGCVKPNESSEDWLIKNFGAFRAMARLKDFSTLNMVFSGLEVLNLLSPAQKAELLLKPEVASLDNGTLTLVFHSLLTGDTRPPPTASPGYSTVYPSRPTYGLYSTPSPHDSLRETVNGFMMAFRPIGSFVHDFVSFTQERNVSEIRSTTLTQFLLNWTLAELADVYQPQNTSLIPEEPKFDVTNVEDWFQHVVMPVLRRFLPNVEDLLHENITLAFHEVFYLDHDMTNQTTSEIQDVCSITLDKSPCGLTDAVENVANVLHCAARSNLTMSEVTIMRLIEELTVILNSLMIELSTANFEEVAYNFQEIFREPDSPSMTQSHLEDPNFIKLWFKLKLMPLLPDIPIELLSCLSTKNFSCPVFQTIVEELSKHMRVLYSDPKYSQNIYKHFIFPFLLHHNTSDPQCVSGNSSAEWLMKNFGFFSRFASITDFYRLNPNFSGLDVLPLLTPKQIAEMLLLPLPTPPEKDVVIDQVFDFLIESHEDVKFAEVLYSLVQLAKEVNPPCSVYKQIFYRLYGAIQALPRDVEPVIWAGIDKLIYVAPEECVPENITCPVTPVNGTNICRGVNSSDLQAHLSGSMDVPCNFTLETYACAPLENFTAYQLASLLKCNLPGSSSHSKVLWKVLLTKLSSVLDPALHILANMSMTMIGPSASEILDVIGEIRLSMLTDEQLNNNSIIRKWFGGLLREFLPFASGRFLRCLSNRNISCHSYQQILRVFSHQFHNMTLNQQHMVVKNFILRFLSQPYSGPGCVSGFNSTEWLKNNLGPYSVLLSLREILHLNPQFNPLETLPLLSPKQMAELLVLNLPTLPEKEVIINQLFDFLTQKSEERKIPEFLSSLVIFLRQGNFSCSAYRTLFARLDMALNTVSLGIAQAIAYSKMDLSKHIPPGCIIYSAECPVTFTNETNICLGVNSTMLQHYLDSGKMKEHLCHFGVEEFACAELSALTAEDLAAIFQCNRSSNTSGSRPAWKLLLSKASHVLDAALDLLTNTTLNPRNPALSMILDAIREIRLDMGDFKDLGFIQLWFNGRLRPFLPAVSSNFLSCLNSRVMNCRTYQHFVQNLCRLEPRMPPSVQMSVVKHFMEVFLTRNNTADPSCSLHSNNSGQWLWANLGCFSDLLSFHQIQMIYPDFSPLEALSHLTVRQLVEVSSTPGQLTSAAQVTMVMNHVPNRHLTAFFDEFSPAIMGNESAYPSAVRSAMLQVVFDRANLSDHSVGDSVVLVWLHNRLRPLLVNLSPNHVAPFFGILAGRNCSIEQQGVWDLNAIISTLSETTQKEIHNHIIQSLRGPTPLRCYGNNFSHSFYGFLESSFMGFQFPNLTTFLSLMPPNRMHQLVNSIPVSGLGDFLRRPDIVDNDEQLCVIYNNYNQTPVFLETEALPAAVRRPTLPCVWPTALSSSERSEINAWFDKRLSNYLVFLTKSLLSPTFTNSTSCLAFQKLVSVLGQYNYTAADFVRRDVFTITINSYLSSGSVLPRCYSANDPELNSTAWFAEYIGPFMNFLTLEDFEQFGSAEAIQVFTVNPANIALLNHTVLPRNLTDYYTQLIYQQDSNFNPLLLPLLCRCVAAGPAFSQLTPEESIVVLQNLTTLCTNLDPQISAALAGNLGDNIDSSAIAALGNESTGISTGQIKMMNPQDLLDSLSVLSSVMGWNEGQAKAIIQALMSSGMLEINSASSLFMLGSLIVGIPSNTFSSIDGSQLITASANPSFLNNMVTAPLVVQQTFVTQIVSVNTNSEAIINNVPDDFATEIPRALLLGFSGSSSTITKLNQKKWKQQQVELFFSVMGGESGTALLGSPDDLSSSILQGFTCTAVRTIRRVQIRRLIRACRRSGTRRVRLVETQLTCMYNYIRGESDVTSFNLYPPDMLLYYDYSLVPLANCRSYFEQLADADFSVFSLALRYRVTNLFANARSCLGITSTSLTEDNISVLGNMCCVLGRAYIENSDPSILDRLNNCPNLNNAQAAAVQSLLLSGRTKYGAPSTWNEQTLRDLGMLPLYMTSTFYDNFNKRTKRRFLRYFLRVLRRNKVNRWKKRRLRRQIRLSIRNKSKRSIANECTVGTITQVTISDEAFPFDYDDINQFNCCLSAATVKDNLASITDKVEEEEYLKIVLTKLQEAYASTSVIPEDQVQLLGPVSRLASTDDISKWTITAIDTLSALMDESNGEWDPSLAKAVISKYLGVSGNKLGSAELNVIGGVNLCSLDADILRSISQESLKNADALTVSNCTLEKKKELFTIAVQAFARNTRTTIPTSSYQLTSPYMGGATLAYVRTLSSSNVSMDMATFTSLDESVVQSLSVDEVKGLLGTNLPELKSYENETLVQNWISTRLQSDLDTLGLGLTGGRADPTPSPATQAPGATAPPSSQTTAAGSGSATTSHSGARIQAEQAGLSFLILLALLVTSLHIIV